MHGTQPPAPRTLPRTPAPSPETPDVNLRSLPSARPLAAALLVVSVALAGCDGFKTAARSVLDPDPAQTESEEPGKRLAPGDFAAAPDERAQRERVLAEPIDTTGTTARATDDATTGTKSPDDAIVVDAMVGQVTGRPIYASAIFKRIGIEQLERLGQTLPRLTFKERVTKLIVGNLRDQITNALILAEAEAGLTQQMQIGVLQYLDDQRKQILAKYQGSIDLANKDLMRTKGITLAQELEERRQKALVDRYMSQKIYPKITVNRREVKRYYDDHIEEYSAQIEVQVRVMIVTDADDIEKAKSALEAGDAFAKVASEYSRFRASDGGLMPAHKLDGSIEDYAELNWPELNTQVAKLDVGGHSPMVPIKIGEAQGAGWVYLEKLIGGEGKTLEEAQIEIERKIRTSKFNVLSRRYIEELWEKGNYTSVEQMAETLIDVAMARYARPL